MTARMDDAQCQAALQDAIALVTANRHPEMAPLGDSFIVAMELLRIQPGEDTRGWLERIATTLDLLAHWTGACITEWGRTAGLDPDEIVRRFAAGFTG